MKPSTLQNFIERANKVHNNTYDYSQVLYINSNTHILVICKIHGLFKQIPFNHLGYGKTKGTGCKHCSRDNELTGATNDFIEKAKLIHGNMYDYSQVKYKGTEYKVSLLCNKHGEWQQSPVKHLEGNGCPRCIGRHQTTQDFIDKAKLVHGDVYDYSKVEYNGAHTKVLIICKNHGSFLMTPVNHISHNQGCVNCYKSKGENEIKALLQQHQINFIQQKTFDTCINPKSKRKLKFDFFIPECNTLIEYDGMQHYKFVSRFHKTKKDLIKIQTLDKIKNQFCNNHGYRLIRIRYNQNIKEELSKLLNVV